jgi:hypothetical protein
MHLITITLIQTLRYLGRYLISVLIVSDISIKGYAKYQKNYLI